VAYVRLARSVAPAAEGYDESLLVLVLEAVAKPEKGAPDEVATHAAFCSSVDEPMYASRSHRKAAMAKAS
jgi:hypothetical protein